MTTVASLTAGDTRQMTTRPSRPLHLMRHAILASERSTCSRLNVGALVFCHLTRTVISMGYNGPKPGASHCGPECLTHEPCSRSIHAEANAIGRAALHDGCEYDLYVSHSPCSDCANIIYNRRHKIVRLFYGIEFRSTAPLDHLARVMEVYKVTPAGYITRHGHSTPINPESLYA